MNILSTAAIDALIIALVTIRLGKFLIKEFERSDFDITNMDNMAERAFAVLFIVPGTEEVKEVFEFIPGIEEIGEVFESIKGLFGKN